MYDLAHDRLLLIGSQALMHHFRHFPREPADFDWFASTGSRVDADGDIFTHPLLDAWLVSRSSAFIDEATIDELYTIKVSHSHWELGNGSWNKHMHDVVWLRERGAQLDMELYELLVKVWAEVHGAKKMKLQRSKEDFFSDAVKRIYDHDSIHMSVAYGERPLYEQFLRDGQSVDMDMAKVKAAPHSTIVALFREEVYATALERILIPRSYRYSPGAAYLWALRRTITSLTKGWSSRFMIENYKFFRKPEPDYLARHLSNKHLLVPLEKS